MKAQISFSYGIVTHNSRFSCSHSFFKKEERGVLTSQNNQNDIIVVVTLQSHSYSYSLSGDQLQVQGQRLVGSLTGAVAS